MIMGSGSVHTRILTYRFEDVAIDDTVRFEFPKVKFANSNSATVTFTIYEETPG